MAKEKDSAFESFMSDNSSWDEIDTDVNESMTSDETLEEYDTPQDEDGEQFTPQDETTAEEDLNSGDDDEDTIEDLDSVDDDEELDEEVPVKKPTSAKGPPPRIKNLIDKQTARELQFEQLELEAAQREASLMAALVELQRNQVTSRSLMVDSLAKEAESAISVARAELRKAKESMDEEAEINATEKLAEALALKREAARAKTEATTTNVDIPKTIETPQEIVGKRKANTWVNANNFVRTNPGVQSILMKVDQELQQEGLQNYQGAYYRELTKRTNKILKSRGYGVSLSNPFWPSASESSSKQQQQQSVKAKPKAINPVSAPSTPRSRSSANGQSSVRLDDYAKQVIRKLGAPEDAYRNQAKASKRTDKHGYSEIFIPTSKGNK